MLSVLSRPQCGNADNNVVSHNGILYHNTCNSCLLKRLKAVYVNHARKCIVFSLFDLMADIL